MENGGEDKHSSVTTSYRYWVREASQDAAPLPVPRKLSADEVAPPDSQPLPVPRKLSADEVAPPDSQPPTLGSIWNKAGTWEEKNLNKWAADRIKELLGSIGSVEFPAGKAQIAEVTKCSGDAFLVTVRNKKRVGCTYEITLKIKGEWTIREEIKTVKGHVDIPEFSYGELDDLQVEVRLSEEKDLPQQDKIMIKQDLKQFLNPVREKLSQFEEELKDR